MKMKLKDALALCSKPRKQSYERTLEHKREMSRIMLAQRSHTEITSKKHGEAFFKAFDEEYNLSPIVPSGSIPDSRKQDPAENHHSRTKSAELFFATIHSHPPEFCGYSNYQGRRKPINKSADGLRPSTMSGQVCSSSSSCPTPIRYPALAQPGQSGC